MNIDLNDLNEVYNYGTGDQCRACIGQIIDLLMDYKKLPEVDSISELLEEVDEK
jgi:hypothetical protein